MNIIEIAALSNGAHRNQNGSLQSVPEGWAMIPEGFIIPTSFPFVDIETEIIGDIPTVTVMTAREILVVEELEQ